MGPIRGQTRPVPIGAEIKPSKTNVQLNASIHNRFDIEVVDAESGKVRQRAQAENVICNGAWTTSLWNAYIQYGSGSGTPSAADTTLFNFVGSKSSYQISETFDSALGVYSVKKKIQLSETEGVGITITEIGVGPYSGSGICTHAMLKDMNGNQISISKTGTDILNIYATVFCHVSGDFRKYYAFGVDSNVFRFATGVAYLDSTKEFYSPQLNGLSDCTGSLSITYTQDKVNKKFTGTLGRQGASSANYRGITALIGNNEGTYNYEKCGALYLSSLWYDGSNVTAEAIGTGDGATKDYSTIFGFVKPGAKVYVNGVEDTAVIVNTGTPTITSNFLIYCLRMVDEYGYATRGRFPAIYDTQIILFNPHYATMGITAVKTYYAVARCYVSDDLSQWTQVAILGTGGATIAQEYAHSKYFKFVRETGTAKTDIIEIGITAIDCDVKNIHFSTPPIAGSVITADYSTDLIAKDANNVLDIAYTIQLGEHTGT